MKKFRVQAIVSHVEFIDVEAENAEEAEEIAKGREDWSSLELGDWEIDDVSEITE